MEYHERKPWLKNRWPFLVIGGMALLALLYSGFREVGIIRQLRQEVEKLRSNPSYIEEIARRELGLMGKKEIVIPLDRKSDAASPPAPGSGTGRP
jgi:hypothetical protein